MRVVHVCGHLSLGGVVNNVLGVARSLTQAGINNEVIGIGVPQESTEEVKITSLGGGFGFARWGWSKQAKSKIIEAVTAEENTVVHVRGIWMATHLLGGRTANQLGVPLTFSSHGQLRPWIIDGQGLQRKIEKEAYWSLVASRTFGKADVAHALTGLEKVDISGRLPEIAVKTIPCSVDLGSHIKVGSPPKREGYLLYMGRLHPVKAIERIIKSFSQAQISNRWRLIIAGPEYRAGYADELRQLALEEGVGGRIDFLGPVVGEEKRRLVSEAWCQVLTSHSESIGMVNLEAGALRTPTITTHDTGLHDWEDGGGLLVNASEGEISRAFEAVCSWTDSERRERGALSLELIRDRYSHDVVIPKWIEFYHSLVGQSAGGQSGAR